VTGQNLYLDYGEIPSESLVTKRQVALAYAKEGWPVFLLHNPADGGCSCGKAGCSDVGNPPRTRHGFNDATTDPNTINEWWDESPEANIGIPTGLPTGLMVVDVDADKGGLDTWGEWLDINGVVNTKSSITGGGGNHYLFLTNGQSFSNSVQKLGQGIDIRGDGGYFVAPPSLHESGQLYEWEGNCEAISLVPGWLVEKCRTANFRSNDTRTQTGQLPDYLFGDIPEGSRDETLTRVVGYLHAKITDKRLVGLLLHQTNQLRCRPPLKEHQVNKILDSILARNGAGVYRGGSSGGIGGGQVTTFRHPMDTGAEIYFDDLNWVSGGRLFCHVVAYAPDGNVLANTMCEMSSTQSRYSVAQELARRNGAQPEPWADELLAAWHTLDQQHRESAEPFSLKSLADQDEPGPLSYVWGDLIPTGFPSNCYGDGGASKSTTVTGLAVSITQGKPFLGLQTVQGPVLYLDWELNEEAFLRRLYPICRGMGIPTPPDGLMYSRLTEPLAHHLPDIIQACNQVQPVLVIIDSLGPAAAADPNDTKAMIGIVQATRKLRTACLMVDHQSKTPGQSYSSKSAYGSGYKGYLVRGGMQLELASSEAARASVVLRHTKHSFTYKHGPIAYHISYDDDAIRFQ